MDPHSVSRYVLFINLAKFAKNICIKGEMLDTGQKMQAFLPKAGQALTRLQ